MEQVIVSLGHYSYSILIFNALFKNFSYGSLFFKLLKEDDRVVIITDNCVALVCLDVVCMALRRLGIIVDWLVVPFGEKNKSLVTLDVIFTKLLKGNYDRSTTVLAALGGGVIGDLVGFVAATYLRGVRFIQIPTTLLAQVDASIGGKTGVNHILGKNMFGVFYHPIAVFIDIDFLRTLPFKEFVSGLAEVIKYAVVFDINFFYWLENYLDDLLSLNVQSLMYCIRRCCELKASIVSIDEFDTNVRGVLNFGHTYGHAIEAYCGYSSQWSHGRSIAVGMVMAMYTSLRLGNFSFFDLERVKALLVRATLPVCGPKVMKPEDYLQYMVRDKKMISAQFNLILPTSIGCARYFYNVNYDVVFSAIQDTYE